MKRINKAIALFFALCIGIAGIPVTEIKAADAVPDSYEQQSVYVDLSDEIVQMGGYLQEASAEETAALSYTQEERRAYLKTRLVEAWDSLEESCDVSGYGITVEDLKAVYPEALNENPQFYYVWGGYSYSYSNNTVVRISIRYTMTAEEIRNSNANLEAAVSEFLRWADFSWSDMEKALYINDYLARNCEYDTTYTGYTAYDALVEKRAVCQGYALAYQLLANKLGLSSVIVSSETLNHEWNMVRIGDNYYHIDVTWNDPTADRLGRSRHQYFMKSSSYFNSEEGEHKADDWVIGGGVVQEAASDTSYDAYFWNSVDTGFEYLGGYWYGISNAVICKYSCDGTKFVKEADIKSVSAVWPVWEGSGYWVGSYASLASFNGRLYYSLKQEIYELDPSTGVSSVVYSLSEEQKAAGYIYGMRITPAGECGFLLATSPNSGATVGIYTASRFAISLETPVLTGISRGSGGVQVTWNQVAGADGYIVYRKTTSGKWATLAKISGRNVENYTDNTKLAAGTYYYTVRAYCLNNGTYTYGGYDTTGLSVEMSLTAPVITGVTTDGGQNTVTWQAVNQAAGYVIYRKTAGGSWSVAGIVTGQKSSSFTDSTNLTAGTTYYYTVRAYQVVNGVKVYGGYDPTGIAVETGIAAVILSGVSSANGVNTITWEKVSGVSGYVVYRKTSGGSWKTLALVAGDSTVSYTDASELTPGTVYYYTVRGYLVKNKTYTYGGYDAAGKGVAASLPSVSLVSAAAGAGKNTITWQPVSGADGYVVYRKTSGGSWTVAAVIAGAETSSYEDTQALVSNTDYYYTVRAYMIKSGVRVYGSYDADGILAQ